MEKILSNGTIIVDKQTNKEFKIIDVTQTNNQFGYGVYLYKCKNNLNTCLYLYRKEFIVKKNNSNTIIISGFPAVGKSYFVLNNNINLMTLDSDSSKFSWIIDKNGKCTKKKKSRFP